MRDKFNSLFRKLDDFSTNHPEQMLVVALLLGAVAVVVLYLTGFFS